MAEQVQRKRRSLGDEPIEARRGAARRKRVVARASRRVWRGESDGKGETERKRREGGLCGHAAGAEGAQALSRGRGRRTARPSGREVGEGRDGKRTVPGMQEGGDWRSQKEGEETRGGEPRVGAGAAAARRGRGGARRRAKIPPLPAGRGAAAAPEDAAGPARERSSSEADRHWHVRTAARGGKEKCARRPGLLLSRRTASTAAARSRRGTMRRARG